MQGPGGIRTGLSAGNVIYADLIATTPFENTLLSVELPGAAIREALEYSVSNLKSLRIMQVSGIKVVYNLKRDAYSRIVDLKVLCQACEIPKYEPIDDSKYYRVVLADYIAAGGDGFSMFPKYIRNVVTGIKDVDALSDYIENISPVNIPHKLGRITFV